MSARRVPSAHVASTVVLVLCCVGWGALGTVSLDPHAAMPLPLHRYLCILLATVTINAVMINLFARLVRAIRAVEPAQPDDGYADGYADGLAISSPRNNVAQMPPRGSIRS